MMPAAQALVMPSVFPEAFGMVAAEAAACGVPPVSADHSGMREVSRELAEAVPEHAGLLSFDVGEAGVEADAPGEAGEARRAAAEAIAERVNGWLALLGRRARAGGGGIGRAGRPALELGAGGRGRHRCIAGTARLAAAGP